NESVEALSNRGGVDVEPLHVGRVWIVFGCGFGVSTIVDGEGVVNDERELDQVAQTIVTLSDQGQILRKPPPEKRFIFGLGDLNNYRNHLTTFLMRVKGLQGQAMALQNQQNSGPLQSVPPPVAQQGLAPAPLQPAA
ncbi:hypothetical protein FS837_004614, partial [Tulasnella sp. UAMH 9824]